MTLLIVFKTIFFKECTLQKVINENVLRVAKHQYKHVNRLSTDIFVDAQATKSFYNTPLMNKNSTSIQGYIHDIRQDNFGILLYCENQVIVIGLIRIIIT